MGADKICYGTDYPFPLGDLEHGRMIEEMDDLAPIVKQQLFKDNVLTFLGLEAEEFVRTTKTSLSFPYFCRLHGPEGSHNWYCSSLENCRAQAYGGSSPSPSADYSTPPHHRYTRL